MDLPNGNRSAVHSPSSWYYEHPLVQCIQWVKRIYEGVSEGLDEADQKMAEKNMETAKEMVKRWNMLGPPQDIQVW
jgi:hypothetical protein